MGTVRRTTTKRTRAHPKQFPTRLPPRRPRRTKPGEAGPFKKTYNKKKGGVTYGGLQKACTNAHIVANTFPPPMPPFTDRHHQRQRPRRRQRNRKTLKLIEQTHQIENFATNTPLLHQFCVNIPPLPWSLLLLPEANILLKPPVCKWPGPFAYWLPTLPARLPTATSSALPPSTLISANPPTHHNSIYLVLTVGWLFENASPGSQISYAINTRRAISCGRTPNSPSWPSSLSDTSNEVQAKVAQKQLGSFYYEHQPPPPRFLDKTRNVLHTAAFAILSAPSSLLTWAGPSGAAESRRLI